MLVAAQALSGGAGPGAATRTEKGFVALSQVRITPGPYADVLPGDITPLCVYGKPSPAVAAASPTKLQPIPTQWPRFKLMLIPTQWSNAKIVELSGDGK
jgi:hypothetical protein